MRQELLAGLIVVTFGLPMAIIADGKDLARELTAVGLAVRGNPAPLKEIWRGHPQADELPQPRVDALAAILSAGEQAMAEARTAPQPVHHWVESPVMQTRLPPISQDDIFVLAGAKLELASRQLTGLGTVALAAAKWDTGDRVSGQAYYAPRVSALATAVSDELSLDAYAEPAPQTPSPTLPAQVAASTASPAIGGPWIRHGGATLAEGMGGAAMRAAASTDRIVADAKVAVDADGEAVASDSFQQIDAIDGGFTSAVPVQTSIGGLTDVITVTR